MVEKIAESGTSAAVNSDVALDEGDLLARIAKKKKHQQSRAEALPVNLPSAEILLRLTQSSVHGGGRTTSETAALPQALSLHAALDNPLCDMAQGRALRRRVLLAAGAQNDPVKTAPPLAEGLRSAASAPLIVTGRGTADDFAQSARTPRSQDPQEGRLPPAGMRMPEISWPVTGNAQAQNKQLPATLQQMKNPVSAGDMAEKSASVSRTLEVNYAFQRWSGEHSVKVSLPAQTAREGMVTLLPSDTRAADALSRHMGQLSGMTPELLQPQKDRDEQQQRRQPQQDEEQE